MQEPKKPFVKQEPKKPFVKPTVEEQASLINVTLQTSNGDETV